MRPSQLTMTKGSFFEAKLWKVFARSDLPVPDSPMTSTVRSSGLIIMIWLKRIRTRLLCPMNSGNRTFPSTLLNRSLTCSKTALNSLRSSPWPDLPAFACLDRAGIVCIRAMKFFMGFSKSHVISSAHRKAKAPMPTPHHFRYRSGFGTRFVYFRIWCVVMTESRAIPPKMTGTSR